MIVLLCFLIGDILNEYKKVLERLGKDKHQ